MKRKSPNSESADCRVQAWSGFGMPPTPYGATGNITAAQTVKSHIWLSQSEHQGAQVQAGSNRVLSVHQRLSSNFSVPDSHSRSCYKAFGFWQGDTDSTQPTVRPASARQARPWNNNCTTSKLVTSSNQFDHSQLLFKHSGMLLLKLASVLTTLGCVSLPEAKCLLGQQKS